MINTIKKESGLLRKIMTLDSRIIWGSVALCIILTTLYPIGLPITIGQNTKNYYNMIESLSPGSVVLYNPGIPPGMLAEVGPGALATLQQLFVKQGVKIIEVCFSGSQDEVAWENQVLSRLDQSTKKYGEEWVIIGYVPGMETGMTTFAENFLYMEKDIYSDSLAEMPLMKEVKSMNDVDMYIYVGGTVYTHIRQLSGPYPNLEVLVCTTTNDINEVLTFQKAGQVDTYIAGIRNAAEYELLRGKPGFAIKGQDALNITISFLIILVIFTNIIYIVSKILRWKS